VITVECLADDAPVLAKDQGNRPTCLAFAIADLNRRYAPEDLGPEYFYQAAIALIPGWLPGNGLQIPAAMEASRLGHPIEREFPYQDEEPLVAINTLPPLQLYGRSVSFFDADVERVISTLQAGSSLGLALRLTVDFYQPIEGVISFSETIIPGAMVHAVVAVGLGFDSNGEPWILIRNSWGEAWGLKGHAWVSSTYIAAHAACAFGVEHGSSDSK
jgi:hypothetical protein